MPTVSAHKSIDIHRLDHFRNSGDSTSPAVHIRPSASTALDAHTIQWNTVNQQNVRYGVGAIFGNDKQVQPIHVNDVYTDAKLRTINSSPLTTHIAPSLSQSPNNHHSTHTHNNNIDKTHTPSAFATNDNERFADRNNSIHTMQQADKFRAVHQRTARYANSQQLQSDVLNQHYQHDLANKYRDIGNLRKIASQRAAYEQNITKA